MNGVDPARGNLGVRSRAGVSGGGNDAQPLGVDFV